MAGKAYLGVDAGTSVVKAAIFDQNGDALAVQGRSIPLMHERGGQKGAVEQDFEVILATMSAVVADAIREAGQAPESVALTGQGDGCWVTDEKFHPVRPAVSWLDGRAGPLVDEWSKSGVLQEVYEICGGAMFPGAPAAALKWLDLNEPETLDRAATAGYCKDALFGRLTGVRATDPSDASPSVTSSSRCTRQPSVVPTMSSASPSVPGKPMPDPNPQAGKSNGPDVTGVPAGRPSRAAPSACSSATGTGATIGASNERRSVSPVSSSTRSL